MAPPPRRGQVRSVLGDDRRHLLIYSGDMFNDLDDEPYVITMDVVDQQVPMSVQLPRGSWAWYTRLDHFPKTRLGPLVDFAPQALMETINTKLFMVLTTN